MRYSQARPGRIFVVRLEDGDVVHECLARLAQTENLQRASLTIVGALDEGSTLVVGPEAPRARPVVPMSCRVDEVREIVGVGTIFPNERGEPEVHVHMACGQKRHTVTGCIRLGVRVWHVMEAIVTELLDTQACRRPEPETGFELLAP
jgi:predicted DNA-binding protein with PD1-like motif